jgi:hypothetical protein
MTNVNTLFPYIEKTLSEESLVTESNDMNEANRASYESQLKAEVAVLTEMVRVLSDRIAQMDAEKTLQALHDENERLGLYDPNGT